jgi:anti-sigma regulatory factor (Ser/Thr protein kinase)
VDDNAAVELPPEPTAAAQARRFAGERCSKWGVSEARDAVVLLVSELVTNAVKHARSQVRVRLVRRARAVRVEVHDNDPTPPSPRVADSLEESGRGFGLITALTCKWGVEYHEGNGKTVWFDVALAPH